MTRVVIVVQCRMASMRLPGKALMPAGGGLSILELLLRRLQLSVRADALVLTTGDSDENKPIVEVCEHLGVPVFRGPEDDVLGRFVACAEATKADVIVRVCADNPLTDPKIIDEAVVLLQATPGLDHVSTYERHTFPYGTGCAVFTRETLSRVAANTQPGETSREHVEPYMLQSDEIVTHYLKADESRCLPHLRVTVDTPRDYDFVRPIAEALVRRHGLGFDTGHLVSMVRQPKVAVFANGRLGRDGIAILKDADLPLTAVITHPPENATLRDEIRNSAKTLAAEVLDYPELGELGPAWFTDRNIDLCLSLWSSYLFPSDMIDVFPLGIFNLHNSLLPALKGSGANIWSLIDRIPAGVSLHRITSKVDSGPIIDQRALCTDLQDTGRTIFDKQHKLMLQILKERISDLPLGRYQYVVSNMTPSFYSKGERDTKKFIRFDQHYEARRLIDIIRAYDFCEDDSARYVDEDGSIWHLRIRLEPAHNESEDGGRS